MNGELKILNNELEIELCRLLGDAPSDFIVLYADDHVFPDTGTPVVSDSNRLWFDELVDKLNSDFASFDDHWKRSLAKLNLDKMPVFSWKIHRVSGGYSQHLFTASRLFENSRITGWEVKCDVAGNTTALVWIGEGCAEATEPTPALAISTAVMRALKQFPAADGE